MKRVLMSMAIIAALSTALYLGVQKVHTWNQSSVQQATETEQERWMVDVEKLKDEVKELKDELYIETALEAHARKVSEVMGTPEGIAPSADTDTPGCRDSEKRLLSFFNYLNKKYPSEIPPLTRFRGALSHLAASPPEIMERELDTLALFRNIAHLYRALSGKEVRVFRHWVEMEPDAIEAFLPDLYKVMMDGTCSQVIPVDCTQETAIHYATFFLNTLGGRSYLLRRNARYRILATYYSVLVLHQADLSGTNLYGVNILPHLERLQSEIALYKGLAKKTLYLTTLEKVGAHYRNR